MTDLARGAFMLASETYWKAGWTNVLPIGDGTGRPGKSHPPRGYTGYDGNNVSWPDLCAWTQGMEGALNLGIRMTAMVGIDVDAHDGETGGETIRKAEAELGPLPPTYSSTSRGPGDSRILFYRVPLSREGGLRQREKVLVDQYGPNVEILHRGHRYAVAWPSVHPDTGQTYQWYGPDGQLCGMVPRREDVPELPPTWLDYLAPETVTHEPVTGLDSSLFLNAGDPLFDSINRRSPRAAQDILAGALAKFTAPDADGRASRLLPALALIAGHGIPGGFWTEQQAREGIEKAAIECGYVQKHGLADLRTQVDRGLRDGALAPWLRVAEEDSSPFSVPEAVQGGGRLRKAMLSRSQIHELADPVPLIEDVLYRDSVVVLAGKFGTYKSFVAVSWAASLATGRDWFGHRVPMAVPVIYAAAEGAYGIRKRLNAWEAKYGLEIPDSLYLIPISVRLNRDTDVRELDEIVKETGAQALVFDTLHMSTPGVDENDSGEMGKVFDVLRSLQQRHGLTSILPHHTGHAGERSRGSSSVEDDADTSFVIRLEGEDRGPENKRILVHRKTKDAALLEDVPLTLDLMAGTGSGVVRASNAYEDAANQAVIESGQWKQPELSVPEMIIKVLAEDGRDRGFTKTEARGIVVERFYGGQSKRLLKQTWGGGWNRALQREEVVNVGGERFSTDPLVIAAYRKSSTESD